MGFFGRRKNKPAPATRGSALAPVPSLHVTERKAECAVCFDPLADPAREVVGRHPFTRVYPSRVRVKGVQFGGRVRVRVRVRVSQGCRRFAKGEGKGAGNSINPFSRRAISRRAISRKTSGAVPRTTLDAFVRARPGAGCHRSMRTSHCSLAVLAVIDYPCPCTVSSCSAALRDPNQPRATPRPRPPAHHYRPPPAPLNHAAETILQEGEKDRHAAAHRQEI